MTSKTRGFSLSPPTDPAEALAVCWQTGSIKRAAEQLRISPSHVRSLVLRAQAAERRALASE